MSQRGTHGYVDTCAFAHMYLCQSHTNNGLAKDRRNHRNQNVEHDHKIDHVLYIDINDFLGLADMIYTR